MTSEMTDIVKYRPGVIGGEEDIALLPHPLLPHGAYLQHIPLARGIVAEYQKSYDDLRDESHNTDMWAIAEEFLRIRIADSIERAVLAERERCAQIAESRSPLWEEATAIAAAIRQQATP